MLIPELREQAQGLLNQGQGVSRIAIALGLSDDALHKAIGDGRLAKP